KGFDVLVRAAARAGVPVVIVGEGDQRDGLEALIASTGAHVELVGALPPAALAARYRDARAVVVPSRREGFGIVAAEAAAAGRAVIASAVGGLPDIVQPGVNGVLVPPDDVDALARALATLDPSLGAGGPATVAWLSPESIAARNIEVYEQARLRSGT